jgi:hypothetical protein
MTTKIARLRREARAAAKWRCHRLSRFQRSGNRLYARCGYCGKSVTVVERPLPNECEVMGESVAVNCPAKEGRA